MIVGGDREGFEPELQEANEVVLACSYRQVAKKRVCLNSYPDSGEHR